MKTEFAEVKCNFFDDYINEWCVDAWKTDSGDEVGEVVARINPITFEVLYANDKYKNDEYVIEVIKEKLKEILSGE